MNTKPNTKPNTKRLSAQSICFSYHKDIALNNVNIEAYAMRSVKNLFLNTIKKESREVGEQNEDGESVYETTEDPTSGRFVDEGDLSRVLIGMEVKCREILTLHALGNSYKEISEVLSIKAGTVMSRMARCREHLDPIMGGR